MLFIHMVSTVLLLFVGILFLLCRSLCLPPLTWHAPPLFACIALNMATPSQCAKYDVRCCVSNCNVYTKESRDGSHFTHLVSCRHLSCTHDKRCDICKDWTAEEWAAFLSYYNSLKQKSVARKKVKLDNSALDMDSVCSLTSTCKSKPEIKSPMGYMNPKPDKGSEDSSRASYVRTSDSPWGIFQHHSQKLGVSKVLKRFPTAY